MQTPFVVARAMRCTKFGPAGARLREQQSLTAEFVRQQFAMAVAVLLISGARGRSGLPAGGTGGLCTGRNWATTTCGTTAGVSSGANPRWRPIWPAKSTLPIATPATIWPSPRQVLELSLQAEIPTNVAPWLLGLVGDEPAHAAMAYAFVVYHWAKLVGTTGDMFGARGCLLPSACKSFDNRASARTLLADQQRLAGSPGAAPAAQIALGSEISARESELLGKALEAMPGRMRAGL